MPVVDPLVIAAGPVAERRILKDAHLLDQGTVVTNVIALRVTGDKACRVATSAAKYTRSSAGSVHRKVTKELISNSEVLGKLGCSGFHLEVICIFFLVAFENNKMNSPETYLEDEEQGWRRKYSRMRAATEVNLARNTAMFLQQNKMLANRYDPQKVQAYYRELDKKKQQLYSNSSDLSKR